MDLFMSCLTGTPKSWKGSKRWGEKKLSMYSLAPPNQKGSRRIVVSAADRSSMATWCHGKGANVEIKERSP